MREMLERYPKDEIFHFSESGELRTSDSSSGERDISRLRKTTVTSPATEQTSFSSPFNMAKTRHSSRQGDGEMISAAFPGARSVAFFPIRNTDSEQWHASGLVYTNSPTWDFSVAGELSFLTAFGILVAAETARLEAVKEDKAKSDALGSLSHELRSPLHGVLLSTELMAETKLDVFKLTSHI